MIVLLAQRDPAWSLKKLGYGTGSIGQYGCVITSIAMCLRERGYDVNPITVNDALKAIDQGFVAPSSDPSQINLVNWWNLGKAFSQIEYINSFNYDTVATPLDKLKAYLDQGYSIVLKMKGIAIGGKGDHFVKAKEVIGNNVIIQDPWHANETWITDKYTVDWADTAAEIITGFRVMKITPAQGGNTVNDDEMIVKKTVFAELVDKSTQRDNLYKYFNVDLAGNQVAAITKIVDEIKAAKESCNIDLEKKIKLIEELQIALNTASSTANSRKETLNYIAERLGISSDESTIKGAIEELIDVSDKLTRANKQIEQLTEEYGKEKTELLRQIQLLKDDVAIWKGKAEGFEKTIEALEKKIGEVNGTQAQTNKLQQIIEDIVRFFRNIVKKQEVEETSKEDNKNDTP